MQKRKLKINFLGDISFNDAYRNVLESGSNPFLGVAPILDSVDYSVGNLECFSEGSDGENKLKNPRLKTSQAALKKLDFLKLDLLSLANNHVYDNKLDGVKNTLGVLEGLSIDHVGIGLDTNICRIFQKKIEGYKFSFLNYVTQDTNPSLPVDAEVNLSEFNESLVFSDIDSIRKESDFVVLLLHWGGDVEGYPYPTIWQRNTARKLIDGGADVIIGHHSHTFQPYEYYKGKPIFYSLGNFCFADIVCGGVKHPVGDFNSAVVQLSLSHSQITHRVLHFRSTNLNLSYMRNGRYFFLWRQIVFQIISRSSFLWKLNWLLNQYVFIIFRYFFSKKKTFREKIVGVFSPARIKCYFFRT